MTSITSESAKAASRSRRSIMHVLDGDANNETETSTRYTIKDVIALHRQMFEQKPTATAQTHHQEARNPTNFCDDERTSIRNAKNSKRLSQDEEEESSREFAVQEEEMVASLEKTAGKSLGSEQKSIKQGSRRTRSKKKDAVAARKSQDSSATKESPSSPLQQDDEILKENRRLIDRKAELQSMMRLLSQATISD